MVTGAGFYLTDDCNGLNGNFSWTFQQSGAKCRGTAILTGFSENSRGCFCAETWACSDWGACANSVQARSCSDSNSCGTTRSKPAETQNCAAAPVKKSGGSSIWIILSVLVAAGAGAFYFLKKKGKLGALMGSAIPAAAAPANPAASQSSPSKPAKSKK